MENLLNISLTFPNILIFNCNASLIEHGESFVPGSQRRGTHCRNTGEEEQERIP
jgi:hypothetical protein